jgi:hypothetical protein
MENSTLKTLIQGQKPLHNRNIEITSYPAPGGRTVVEGTLKDTRLVDIYRHWDHKPRPTGTVHWFTARLLVGDWPLAILDAEAEVLEVPSGECVQVFDSVKTVIGTRITQGYSEEIRSLIGGPLGCAHLTHLVIVMGPAALHGFWTLYAQHPRPMPKSLDEVEGLGYLVNSCALWVPDGVHMRMLKEKIAEHAKSGGGAAGA